MIPIKRILLCIDLYSPSSCIPCGSLGETGPFPDTILPTSQCHLLPGATAQGRAGLDVLYLLEDGATHLPWPGSGFVSL